MDTQHDPKEAQSALFAAAFDSSPVPNCLLSPTPDAIVLAANDAFLKAWGSRREDVLGAHFAAAGDDWLRDSLARVLASWQPDTLPVQRYNGERFCRIVNAPVFAADGRLLCISHTVIDMSAEEKYRTLLNSIDEGFCIIDVLFDESGYPRDYRFCEVNSSFEAQTGLHNAGGKTIRELNPSHEEHWFTTYAGVLQTGEPLRFEDGSESLDRHFDVYAFRIEDEGKPKVALLFKDISAQKRAYRQARESEERAIEAARRAEDARRHVEALLQAAPVGIVMSDSLGGITLANAEHDRLWGGNPPVPRCVADFENWKGWWADDSELHGQRVLAHEWPTARALHGDVDLQRNLTHFTQ